MPRYVDADELWKHKFKSASERMDLSVAYMSGWNDAIDSIVENALIVEAEPVRHGQWIDVNGNGSLWRCSVCGETQCCYDNYCGNCGAKMDEVE